MNQDREGADAWTMRALSIRQPYAELILRGIKTIEYRSRRTRIIQRLMVRDSTRIRGSRPRNVRGGRSRI